MEDMLRDLLERRSFPVEILSRQSGVTEEEIQRLLKGAEFSTPSSDEQMEARERLESLAAVLTLGMVHVSADDRVRTVIEILGASGITSQILAGYCRMKKSEIDSFLDDPAAVADEKKYRIASVAMFLYFLFKESISEVHA